MMPEHIAMLIAAPIIVLIIWTPLLDFIGPPLRFLQHRRNEKASHEVTFR
jgi:hypothetical protein